MADAAEARSADGDLVASRLALDRAALGRELYEAVADMYPICRSITGNGVRQTLQIVRALATERVPFEIHEVPTGTAAFDWVVPREWNIRDAFVRNSRGDKVIDFKASNLHVVNYSVPVHTFLTLEQLKPHLFTLPDQPTRIPYRTAYYAERWGFCLAHAVLETLPEDTYEVVIDSTLEPGALTYGECLLPGRSDEEILISVHVCHPSLCNDNLSSIAIAARLARVLSGVARRYSYRFLFIPATIGSILWLSRNESATARIRHGLVLACTGDPGPFTYKRTRHGDAEIDRAVTHVLEQAGAPYDVRDFSPWGYDERQYGSPGFKLPVGRMSRTPHGEFREYHTSGDNLELVRPDALADSCLTCLAVLEVLEGNERFMNTSPMCEPQLGRRGLYRPVAGQVSTPQAEQAMLWVLSFSDGDHTLLDIARRARLPFPVVRQAATRLEQHGLLRTIRHLDKM